MNELHKNSILFADDSRVIHIPWYFAQSFNNDRLSLQGISDDEMLILLDGPTHPEYWEVCDDVLAKAEITVHGVWPHVGKREQHTLYQDGDLWLIPVDAEWECES